MAEALELTTNMSRSLRPHSFSDMIGIESVLDTLRAQFDSGRVSNIKLSGQPGAGKTTLALILAVAVQCDHGAFGDPCPACQEMADNNMFEIIEHNCGAYNKVDDIRGILDSLQYTPSFGRHRIIILNEAQRLTDAAEQALLVSTEDKSPTNVWIMTTSEPDKVSKALSRRFQQVDVPVLDKLGIAQVVELVVVAGGQAEELSKYAGLVEVLEEQGINSPGLVVTAAEKALTGAPFEDCVFGMNVSSNIDIKVLMTATVKGDWETVADLLKDAKPADAQPIRMRLSAWYRGSLLRAKGFSTRGQLLSDFIVELVDHQTPETGLQLSALMASLYRICNMAKIAANQNAGYVASAKARGYEQEAA